MDTIHVTVSSNSGEREHRCAWCWQELTSLESHTVVSSGSFPYLSLRFHHVCWPVYSASSGAQAIVASPWTPAKVEELRLRCGCNHDEFTKRLGIGRQRLRRFLNGDESALNHRMIRALESLKQKHQDSLRLGIDWSGQRALFCLARNMRLSISELASKLGVSYSAAKRWLDGGVPRKNSKAWAVLDRIAVRNNFDVGEIVDDYSWTSEFLDSAIKQSGKPATKWALLARLNEVSVRNYRNGKDAITRNAAWGLTHAAIVLGIALPPTGLVPYKRPEQERHRVPASCHKRRWTPDMVAILGTATDAEVGRRIGKSAYAVAKYRVLQGIPKFTKE